MRYFFISLVLHILVISFVWVGFFVPIGRDQNSFSYWGQGAAALKEGHNGQGLDQQMMKDADTLFSDDNSAAFFTPWLKQRQLNKPH